MNRPRALRIAGVLVLAGIVILAGSYARAELGLEVDPDSIRAFVANLGWKGPAVYLVLVIFRHVLLLPSIIVLPVGGVLFGATLGTLLGGAGITITGLFGFTVSRVLRPEWIVKDLGARAELLQRRIEAAGPWLVAIVTAHPIGPMSPLHWASGLTKISVFVFLAALALGALMRAFAFSFFGSAVLDPGSRDFYLATGLLTVVAFAPLAHPGLRRRILHAATFSDEVE